MVGIMRGTSTTARRGSSGAALPERGRRVDGHGDHDDDQGRHAVARAGHLTPEEMETFQRIVDLLSDEGREASKTLEAAASVPRR
jgi:hypothetical protein